MNMATYETTRFELYDDGFYVEVSNPYGVYNFYLCHKQHVHKSYMFCMPPTETDKESWKKIIDYMIEIYIKLYWEEVETLEKAEDETTEGKFWEDVDASMGYLAEHGTKVTENP